MPPQLPKHIFGMHDPGAESMMTDAGKTGWVVVTVKVSDAAEPRDFTALTNAGLGVIVRLNNGYEPDGTIPFSTQYDTFAQQCASYVKSTQGAKIWIIGNETNHPGERPGGPGGEVITPTIYAQCFAKCRTAIKQLPGHADDWLIPSAPAPWNPMTTYATNPIGDWVKYFADILNQCVAQNAKPDALAIHTYTHGIDPALVTNEDMEGNPAFATRHHNFRAYRDFMGVIPAALKSLPVLITETQPADPDWWQNQSNGWVQAAYKEINDWNAVQTNQPIQALCVFRWKTGKPEWSISDKPAVKADFQNVLSNDYRVRLPSPPPPPPPDPLATAAQASAVAHKPWMPINDQASLYRFAQDHDLGYPQTDEFKFVFNNTTYVCQVYNYGIVYVKDGDWNNCMWVKKPAGS